MRGPLGLRVTNFCWSNLRGALGKLLRGLSLFTKTVPSFCNGKFIPPVEIREDTLASTMYSNNRSRVDSKSSIPLHQDDGPKVVCSALGILSSDLPGGEMGCGVAEGDKPSHNDRTYSGHENTSGARQTMYSAAAGGAFSNSHTEGKIYHRLPESEVQSSEDSGFREQDNMSQNSNQSGSYIEVNTAAKTGTFENVAYLSPTAEDMRSQLSETHGNNQEVLKEELLQIFEIYFKGKMEDRLRGFRSRQREWEETKRAEKEEFVRKMTKEKMEMQKHYANAISKLTHSFNEERKQLEECYEEQLKDLRKKLGAEQKQGEGKCAAQSKLKLKEKLEDEYQEMFMRETLQEKQEAMREKSEIKARFNKEKFELEKNFNFLLTEAEASLHRVRAELKESLCMGRESQKKIVDLEVKLKEERQQRLSMEKEFEEEKAKYPNEEGFNRKENEQLKSEVDVLRQEIQEKNSEIKRLIEANQESNLKIRALTRHLQKRAKRNSEEGSVKSQESEGRATVDDRVNTVQTNTWDMQGNPGAVDTRAVESENTIVKVYDSKLRLTDERKRILVFVTFEKRPGQGLSRFFGALLPKQPISSTVRVLMASNVRDEEAFSEQ